MRLLVNKKRAPLIIDTPTVCNYFVGSILSRSRKNTPILDMVNRFKIFFASHYAACIAGFFMAILVALPLIIFSVSNRDVYQGINIPHYGSDGHFYLTRAKEVLEGHPLGNPFIREGKDKQDYFFTYNDTILFKPWAWLGLGNSINAVTLANMYNFIGVMVLTVLIYFVVFQLSGNKLLSIVAAISAIGGYHLVYNKSFFYNDFNIYGRPMFPYLSSLAFFAYLNALIKGLQTRAWRDLIIAGLLYGLVFYVYFFNWTFCSALNGTLIGLYAIRRDYKNCKAVLIIMGIGIIVGAYSVMNQILYFTSQNGSQAAYFHASSHTYAPILSKIGSLTLLLFIFFVYKRRQDTHITVLFGLILAGWISLNQQIITGRVVEIGHYYWYFIVPISIIISWYMVGRLIEHTCWSKWIYGGVLALVFLHASIGQYASIPVTVEAKRYEQSYQPLLAALEKDQRSGVILAANDPQELLFTIYTHHDLFWYNLLSLTDTPLERFHDALFMYAYLHPAARKDFTTYMRGCAETEIKKCGLGVLYWDIEGLSSGFDYYTYHDYVRRKDFSLLGPHREQTLKTLNAEFSSVKNDAAMNALLKKYEVNYIVWDKNRFPDWDFGFIKNLKLVVANDGLYLYQIDEPVK